MSNTDSLTDIEVYKLKRRFLYVADKLELDTEGETFLTLIKAITGRAITLKQSTIRYTAIIKEQNSIIAVLESARPHWAKGYSSDGVAAQVSTAALSTLWEMLGVSNQTEAVIKLRNIKEAYNV